MDRVRVQEFGNRLVLRFRLPVFFRYAVIDIETTGPCPEAERCYYRVVTQPVSQVASTARQKTRTGETA